MEDRAFNDSRRVAFLDLCTRGVACWVVVVTSRWLGRFFGHSISSSHHPNPNHRYTVNSEALKELGWKERVSWEEGLKATVDWYMLHNGRYGDIESALVPHPSSRPHGECAAGIEEHAAHW